MQYFKCRYGHAYYCPLSQVRPDQRFAESAPPLGISSTGNRKFSLCLIQLISYTVDTLAALQEPLEEQVDQQVPDLYLYVGDQRGIQGHQNSCYLDSTLFGLFALSDIFDEMFLEVTTNPTIDQNRRIVSEMLWKGIVNPLRK